MIRAKVSESSERIRINIAKVPLIFVKVDVPGVRCNAVALW